MTEPILAVDIGAASCAAAIVAQERTALLRDPGTGADAWPPTVLLDDTGPLAGSAAERRGRTATLLPAPHADPVALRAYLAALAAEARRVYGAPIPRLVLNVPAGHPVTDPRRDARIATGAAAGFDEVELVDDAVAVTLDPRTAGDLPDDALMLVFDLGVTWTVSCVHRRGERSRLVAEQSVPAARNREAPDGPDRQTPDGSDRGAPDAGSLGDLLAAGRMVVAAAGAAPADVAAVLLAGGGAHLPGVEAALADALGQPPRRSATPEFAVVRGAARWAATADRRRITAGAPPWRTEPVAWDIPGGQARLLRWAVHLEQEYQAGATLAEVRTLDGRTVGLTAQRAGALPGPVPQPGDTVGPVLAVAARRPAAALAVDPPRVLRSITTTGSFLLSADRHVLLECAADGTSVRSTAAATGEELGVFTPDPAEGAAGPGGSGPGGRLFVDPRGRPALVAWDLDAGVSVWDVGTGKLIVRIAAAVGTRRAYVDESTWRLAVEAENRASVGRYRRSTVTVWDLHTGGRLDERHLHSDWVQRHPDFHPRSTADGFGTEASSPDGRLRAVAGPDGVILYDSAGGRELLRAAAPPSAPGRPGPVGLVAFDGDGSRLLVSWEGTEGSRIDVRLV